MGWISSIFKAVKKIFVFSFFPLLFYGEEKELAFGPTGPSRFFKDETKKYGLEKIVGERFYAVDFDRDTYTDIVVLPENYSNPVFYRFDKDKERFVALEKSPFGEAIRASFLLFHDMDKDGILDVFVGTLGRRSEIARYPLRIFKGHLEEKAVRYKKIDLEMNPLPTSSLALLDYNLDGHIDFFQGNYSHKVSGKTRQAPDRLWKGEEMTFVDQSVLLEKEHDHDKDLNYYPNARPTIGLSICDVDLNGYPDILTASTGGHRNKMWINLYDSQNKGRTFRDYGPDSGYAEDENGRLLPLSGGHTFFGLCYDYNNNGLVDIVVGELTTGLDGPMRDKSSVLSGKTRGFPPTFIRTVYTHDQGLKNWPQGDRRGLFADLNFDGLVDMVIDNSGFPPASRLVYFEQEEDHSFTDKAYEYGINVLNPSGTISLDVNRDGRLDLLIGQTNLRNHRVPRHLFLMVNHIPRNKKRSLRFFLRGKKSNAPALGARLVLTAGKQRFQQFVQYSFGEAPSQMEQGVYFGLGPSRPGSVEVHWPYQEGETLLIKRYDLSKWRLTGHLNVTLCEDGRSFKGIRQCP